ncbi:MAG: glycosyltransferase family 2 protein [Oliverpabstia sp.]|nr:glycosyltransferase family 2 protein [Oliverpabstia sp.]
MDAGKVLHYLKKIKPYNIQKGFRYLKHYGLKEFWIRLCERMEPEEVPYGPWFEKHRPSESELEKQREKNWKETPVFSIVVPAYRTPVLFLEQMIESVRSQTYPFWELCIANASPEDEQMAEVLQRYVQMDQRIHVKNLDKNLGIAENTNEAFFMASGTFVGLLDHDDLLAPQALYRMMERLEEKEIDVFYTDEDKVTTDLAEHFQPHFKPDFNLDLLRSNNYITHFFVVRKELVRKVGGFRREYDGAQDYDFIFRCVEQAGEICHIPEILYHWRTHKESTSDNPVSKMYAFEAGKRAIEGNLERCGVQAVVSHTKDLGFYQVEYPVQGSPLVSVLIPNKDQKESLKKCLDSVFEKTTYSNYEIIIIENNSTESETFEYYRELQKRSNVKVITWKEGFNYSAINNFGEKEASGDYLLFLNNDVEVINPRWMEEMLGNCQRPEVGITGAKLYYPDDTIQHAGTIIGIGGIAGHAFLNMPRSRTGYLHKASIQMNLSAVTAACMMMKRSVFEQIGGFEEKLTVAFNDVDLCLRTVQAGYLVVYNPKVELYHYESKSRGSEDNEEKVRRFQREIEFMRSRWITILKEGDPNYNKNLTLSKWNYSLRA